MDTRRLRILVVEADPELRQWLGNLARHSGADLLEANDDASGLALARQPLPPHPHSCGNTPCCR